MTLEQSLLLRMADALSASKDEDTAQEEAREILGLLKWTQTHRRLLAPDKPVDFRRHKYLLDVYNCTTRAMLIYKAGQMGASEYLISYALNAADERGATVLYVFPTDTHVYDFSSARIGPALEVSEYLSQIVTSGAGETTGRGTRRRGADRVTLKRVRDRFVYLRGAKVTPDGRASQLKAIDADVLILDEVDEMDGRAPAIAAKRLGHSAIAETRLASTPTYHDRGIHAEWQESDQREWFVRCKHCGERQPLTIHNVVTAWDDLGRPTAWHGMHTDSGGQPGSIYPSTDMPFDERELWAWAACRRCGGRLERLGDGEWVAAYSDKSMVGFHLTKLFSPIAPLIEVVENLDTVDETERKEAFNQDLGEPYTPRGGKLTDTILDDCRRDYGHGPVQGEVTTMGVDVGIPLLHVIIRGPADPETGERAQRFAGAVPQWDELGRLMREYNVRVCVIDAGPETTKAREFQSEWTPGKIWLAYYVGQKTGTKKEAPVQKDYAERVLNLDRTRTLDAMYATVYTGKRLLPGNARSIRDYYAQMKAPVRVLRATSGGDVVARYVEEGADHYAHAENYEEVAWSTFGGGWSGGVMPEQLHQPSRWTRQPVAQEVRRSRKLTRPSRFKRRR